MIKLNAVMKIEEMIDDNTEPPRLLVLYEAGQEEITRIFADVLGRDYCLISGQKEGVKGWSDDAAVLGIEHGHITELDNLQRTERMVITTHCVDIEDFRDEGLTLLCDHEYLYTQATRIRKDLSRFLGFVLGQSKLHDDLSRKQRTTLLATSFSDIRGALPNLDILSVGADAVELRVDLLSDPATSAEFVNVPGLRYVGEQVMLLRQRTELPIVFTTRCNKENGKFPMDDPTLVYKYLRKAMQWGCEYIDVGLWLPEDIRRRLAVEKGNSKIISAWHDISGTFKWTSPEAMKLFKAGSVHGDMVKMVALVHTKEDNYDLEQFRCMVQSNRSNPPLCAHNIGPAGQLSRALSKVFTSITHPLLPMVAAPGQLSAAEINLMLSSIGQMPRLDIYAIGDVCASGLAVFFEKCLNELSQPHQLVPIERPPHGTIQPLIARPQFGGASINPPLPVEHAPYLPTLTEAASAIGQVDTIAVRSTNNGRTLVADNVTWKGIRATLTRDFVPSAYTGRSALVIGNSEASAAAAIHALNTLNIGTINTIGFSARDCRQLQGIDELRQLEEPSAIISTLPAGKSMVVLPVLKHYSQRRTGSIFVDLSIGARRQHDAIAMASSMGWISYGVEDVNAWTIVETLRLLVGENVPWNFVKLAGGRHLCT